MMLNSKRIPVLSKYRLDIPFEELNLFLIQWQNLELCHQPWLKFEMVKELVLTTCLKDRFIFNKARMAGWWYMTQKSVTCIDIIKPVHPAITKPKSSSSLHTFVLNVKACASYATLLHGTNYRREGFLRKYSTVEMAGRSWVPIFCKRIYTEHSRLGSGQ